MRTLCCCAAVGGREIQLSERCKPCTAPELRCPIFEGGQGPFPCPELVLVMMGDFQTPEFGAAQGTKSRFAGRKSGPGKPLYLRIAEVRKEAP
jgi:hypothetical protein